MLRMEDPEAFSEMLKNNRDIFLAKPIEAVVIRGSSETALQYFYCELTQIGSAFIDEVVKLD